MNPRSDMYPCHLCKRKLATKEAYQAHIAKCDGRGYHNRGRKPADNTCMVSTGLMVRDSRREACACVPERGSNEDNSAVKRKRRAYTCVWVWVCVCKEGGGAKTAVTISSGHSLLILMSLAWRHP